MSAASAPGVGGGSFRPIPPERGSFPLDHEGACAKLVQKYLDCIKIVDGENARNCRLLAEQYLQCRMDNELMDKDDMDNLGFADLRDRKK